MKTLNNRSNVIERKCNSIIPKTIFYYNKKCANISSISGALIIRTIGFRSRINNANKKYTKLNIFRISEHCDSLYDLMDYENYEKEVFYNPSYDE